MGSSDRDLKASVDQMFQIVQEQAKKRDESDLLMQALASKLDIQGQRLSNMEKDVQSIKMTVTNNNSQATQPKSYTSNVSADYFDNQDKVSEFSQNITEVKCLVREEVRGLGNVCIKCSTDVIMKLDKADKTVFGPLVEATADIKKVLDQMEDMDLGIRTIENATNQYSQILTSLKNETVSNNELRNSQYSQILMSIKNESVSTNELRNALAEIKTNTEKQISISESLSDGDLFTKVQDQLAAITLNHVQKLQEKSETPNHVEDISFLGEPLSSLSPSSVVLNKKSSAPKENCDTNKTFNFGLDSGSERNLPIDFFPEPTAVSLLELSTGNSLRLTEHRKMKKKNEDVARAIRFEERRQMRLSLRATTPSSLVQEEAVLEKKSEVEQQVKNEESARERSSNGFQLEPNNDDNNSDDGSNDDSGSNDDNGSNYECDNNCHNCHNNCDKDADGYQLGDTRFGDFSKTIYIDRTDVGRLIGRGGCNIRQIKEDSECRLINVLHDEEVNNELRATVELHGQKHFIELAIQLIRDTFDTYECKGGKFVLYLMT